MSCRCIWMRKKKAGHKMDLKRRLKFYCSRRGRKYFFKALTQILLLMLAISMAVASLYIASTVANGTKKKVLNNDEFTAQEEILEKLPQESGYTSDSFTVHKAVINGKSSKKLNLYKYKDGTVYIQAEYAEEKIGAAFRYYRQDGLYAMSLGSHNIFLREGCSYLLTDQTQEKLDGAVIYYKNKLLIPFRFLQIMGLKSQIFYSSYNVANSDMIFLNILSSNAYQKYKGRIMALTVKDGYVGYKDCITQEYKPVKYAKAGRIKSCEVSYDGNYALAGLDDKKCLLYFNNGTITNIKEFPYPSVLNKSKNLVSWASDGRTVYYYPKENVIKTSGSKGSTKPGLTSPNGKLKVAYNYNNQFGELSIASNNTKMSIGSYIMPAVFEDADCIRWISNDALIIKMDKELRLFDFTLHEMAYFTLDEGDNTFIAH